MAMNGLTRTTNGKRNPSFCLNRISNKLNHDANAPWFFHAYFQHDAYAPCIFMPMRKKITQQSGNSAGKEHHKPGILRQRRASHRGAHRQRQSAGSHRHQAGPTGPPSMPAPSWPAWSAAWSPPACTRRSSSWWVTTKPECSKRPSRMGGPFIVVALKTRTLQK